MEQKELPCLKTGTKATSRKSPLVIQTLHHKKARATIKKIRALKETKIRFLWVPYLTASEVFCARCGGALHIEFYQIENDELPEVLICSRCDMVDKAGVPYDEKGGNPVWTDRETALRAWDVAIKAGESRIFFDGSNLAVENLHCVNCGSSIVVDAATITPEIPAGVWFCPTCGRVDEGGMPFIKRKDCNACDITSEER